MSKESELIRRVDELARPLLEDMGIEIVDIEWKRETHGRILRFLVDKPEGIDLDTCGKASEVIGHLLDRSGQIDDRYNLEVSSPGVERPLKKPADYQRFVGSKIALRTTGPIDGRRNFAGTLEAADDSGIRVRVEGVETGFAYEVIQKAHLVFEFGPPPKPGKASKPGKQAVPKRRRK